VTTTTRFVAALGVTPFRLSRGSAVGRDVEFPDPLDCGNDPGILEKVQGAVTFIAFFSRFFEGHADEALDQVLPDDTPEQREECAEERRERRRER
jgi:hypothetical protein